MKARGGLAILVCALAAVALPADAMAKPSYVLSPRALHISASLPASNGYAASVETSGHRQVTLTFSQGSYAARYTALGRVTSRAISADFGRLGQISVRFRSRHRSRDRRPPFLLHDCKGADAVKERGVLVGNLRFIGERAFTRLRAHRVRAHLDRSYRQVCRGPSWLRAKNDAPDYEGNALYASARVGGATRSFLALESLVDFGGGEPFGLGVEVAALEEKREGVAITKSVFQLDETLFHLTPLGKGSFETRVSPYWPFLGSGTYRIESGQPATWTGSLGARFPGSGQLSLAGPEFEVDLCRAHSPVRFNRCATRLQPERLFYGSGSHSQPLALARLSSLR